MATLEIYRLKKADQTTTSTTVVDDAEFAWSIDPNGIYVLEATYFVVGAAATTGPRLTVTGPASPDLVLLSMVSAASATTVDNDGASAYATELVGTGSLTTDPGLTFLRAHIENGTEGGRVKVRVGSEVAANVTYKKGSYARLIRVG